MGWGKRCRGRAGPLGQARLGEKHLRGSAHVIERRRRLGTPPGIEPGPSRTRTAGTMPWRDCNMRARRTPFSASRRAQSTQSAQSAMVNHDAPHTTRPRTAAFEVTPGANPVPLHLSHAALNVDLHLLRPRARATRDRRTLLAGRGARAGGRTRARRTRSACWGLARRGGGRARGVDLERRLGRHQRDLPVGIRCRKRRSPMIADDELSSAAARA